MFEIRFKDIDPDTGKISQDKLICTCFSETSSKWLMHALDLSMKEAADPNRDIYVVYKKEKGKNKTQKINYES
jgi:hypothetical protein